MDLDPDGEEWAKRQYVWIALHKGECERHIAEEDWHCQPMKGKIQWDFGENHDIVELLWED